MLQNNCGEFNQSDGEFMPVAVFPFLLLSGIRRTCESVFNPWDGKHHYLLKGGRQ
jgi:hypothetical protein